MVMVVWLWSYLGQENQENFLVRVEILTSEDVVLSPGSLTVCRALLISPTCHHPNNHHIQQNQHTLSSIKVQIFTRVHIQLWGFEEDEHASRILGVSLFRWTKWTSIFPLIVLSCFVWLRLMPVWLPTLSLVDYTPNEQTDICLNIGKW